MQEFWNNIQTALSSFLGKFAISSKSIESGQIFLVPGAVITPYSVYPTNSQARLGNLVETRNNFFLILIAVVLSIVGIPFLLGIGELAPLVGLIGFIILGLLLYVIIREVQRPTRTGLQLECGSGTSEMIVSEDRNFILDLRQRIIDSLSEQSKETTIINLDQRQIIVEGDAAFDSASIQREIAESARFTDNKDKTQQQRDSGK